MYQRKRHVIEVGNDQSDIFFAPHITLILEAVFALYYFAFVGVPFIKQGEVVNERDRLERYLGFCSS